MTYNIYNNHSHLLYINKTFILFLYVHVYKKLYMHVHISVFMLRLFYNNGFISAIIGLITTCMS